MPAQLIRVHAYLSWARSSGDYQYVFCCVVTTDPGLEYSETPFKCHLSLPYSASRTSPIIPCIPSPEISAKTIRTRRVKRPPAKLVFPFVDLLAQEGASRRSHVVLSGERTLYVTVWMWCLGLVSAIPSVPPWVTHPGKFQDLD